MIVDKKSKLNDIKVVRETKQAKVDINQHFLFNTLNSILSLCRGNPEEARKVVLELSSYLRFNFNVEDKIIFLQEEIEYIKSYLYIEKIRFGDRLDIKYDIQEDVNFLIPRNSIYNLIDNAINHGILKKSHGGTVNFIIKRDRDEIIIKIKDDGVGMKEKQIVQALIHGNGGSLSTTNAQYKNLYNAKLKVVSKCQVETCITLYIPINNIKYE